MMKPIFIFFISFFLCISAFAQSDEFGGIGIRFKTDEITGYTIVADVVPRSPADYQGIKKDDLILEIDGTSTLNLSPEDIKILIRGKVGTTLVLKMRRGEKTRDFTLKRVKMIVKDF